MKKIFPIIILTLLAVLTSCKSNQVVTIYGKPGTEIYAPTTNIITAETPIKGTIDQSGKAVLTFNDNFYNAFLVCKDPDSKLMIPMALDSNYKSSMGVQFGEGVGIGLASVGTVLTLTAAGIIMAIKNDSEMLDMSAGILAGGVAAAGIGCGLMLPLEKRGNQTAYQYCYRYLKRQKTPQDLIFKPVEVTEPQKSELVKNAAKNASVAADVVAVDVASSSRKLQSSDDQKSSRSLKVNPAAVEGTYIGTGKLYDKNVDIEQYGDIKITIVPSDNNEVLVRVIEAGTDYFDKPAVFVVTKGADNSYVLKHKTISGCQIVINSDNTITYSNPKVNIENGIYRLELKGSKK